MRNYQGVPTALFDTIQQSIVFSSIQQYKYMEWNLPLRLSHEEPTGMLFKTIFTSTTTCNYIQNILKHQMKRSILIAV